MKTEIRDLTPQEVTPELLQEARNFLEQEFVPGSKDYRHVTGNIRSTTKWETRPNHSNPGLDDSVLIRFYSAEVLQKMSYETPRQRYHKPFYFFKEEILERKEGVYYSY